MKTKIMVSTLLRCATYEAPLRQIVANAGGEGSVVLQNVKAKSGNFGYNAATGEYGDMVKLGILDQPQSNP